MSVLFGHPSGNPNSHHAALAHYESGWLAAFCVAWMPTSLELAMARMLPGLSAEAARLSRRCFAPLSHAPKIQSRMGEWRRMTRRLIRGERAEGTAYEANEWLMRIMANECRRSAVTAVHAYEDCALQPFIEARRLGKACIYDMPIGYYPAWERVEAELSVQYADWVPARVHGTPERRRAQKKEEMAIADVVLAPSTYVARTIEPFIDKRVEICPYGVDSAFWRPAARGRPDGPLRVLYAGSCSLRKGTPLLLDAWRIAGLKEARLELVGSWGLAESKRTALPAGVTWTGPLGAEQLRARYQAADVFVFPSFFEGYGLVMLEAMACGLPVIATDATAGPDVLDENTGRTLPAGDVEALAEALRWFSARRDRLSDMSAAARQRAEACTWEQYRASVITAVGPWMRDKR